MVAPPPCGKSRARQPGCSATSAMLDPAMTEDLIPPLPSEAPIERALLPETAAVDADGRLSIAGVDIAELVATFGTPLFVYDEAHLRTRCREAVAAFGASAAYATK